MERIGSDLLSNEPLRYAARKPDIAELRIPVHLGLAIAFVAIGQIVEINLGKVVAKRRNGHHPGWCASSQQILQLIGQKKRGQVVERKGPLESVDGELAPVMDQAGVVDQHVELVGP